MLHLFFTIITLFLLTGCSQKEVKHNEKYYQTIICKQLDGKMEFVLKDKTRVDCLNDTYAMEVDFAKKWAESIGQSLYYAQMTHKEPAVGLIVGKKDLRYLKRLQIVANELNIKVYIIKKEEQ